MSSVARSIARRTVLALSLTLVGSGCASFRTDPYSVRARCHLPENPSQAELVRHLNKNAEGLMAWRATNARVSVQGVPISMSAMVAVEAPRNFRLLVNSGMGNEVDLGSNTEGLWFWSRQSPQKHVFTCSHERLGVAQRRFPVPIQPDWIMEALGVIPIEERGLVMEPGPPRSRTVRLSSQHLTPEGDQVKKVVVVDTCHGVVREHALYDSEDRLVARAILSGHYLAASNVVMPRVVQLDMPAAKANLTLNLGQVEINPEKFRDGTWSTPEMRGYPALDLGE